MKTAQKIILTVIYALITFGYIALSVWIMWRETGDSSLISTKYQLLFAIMKIVSFLTASAFHELGHALFGLFSRVHARLSAKSVLTIFSTSSVEVIPKTDKKIKRRMIATTLGGLVINLLFIVIGILALTVPQIPSWLSGIAVYNLVLFLFNISPLEYNSGKSDGLVICELIKNEDSAKVMLAVLTVQAQVLNGKPIKEVEEKLLFDLPQIQEDEPAFISLTELRAEYFAAKGDTANAQKYKSRFEQLKKDYLN